MILRRFDDRMESYPHVESDECRCDDCVRPRQVLCEDCKGNGTIFEHVEHGFLEKCTCMTCLGSGYVKEEI